MRDDTLHLQGVGVIGSNPITDTLNSLLTYNTNHTHKYSIKKNLCKESITDNGAERTIGGNNI